MNSEAIIATEIKPQLIEAFGRQTANTLVTQGTLAYVSTDGPEQDKFEAFVQSICSDSRVIAVWGETGAALVDGVDYVSVTGSTATGRKVAMRADAALEQPVDPGRLGAQLAAPVAQEAGCPNHEQTSDVAIALFRGASEPVLAAA